MKKLIVLLLLTIVLSIPAFAVTHPKSFYFTAAVIQSMALFEEGNALLYAANQTESQAEVARTLPKAKSKFREAQGAMKRYLEDSDGNIRERAQAIDKGVEVFVVDGDYLQKLLDRTQRGETLSEEEVVPVALEREKAQNDAYQSMGHAVASYVPEGLTKAERGVLVFRIDLLFSKALKKYRFYPTEVSKIVIAISALEGRLLGKNVESNEFYQPLLEQQAQPQQGK